MPVINATPTITIARMENGGYLIEGKQELDPGPAECHWKHPETCKHCPIKCHLTGV